MEKKLLNKWQIGAQLYTLKDYLKTPKEIITSLEKVKNIGFETVQVSGLGPIDTKELKNILDGEGLKCVITHEPGIDILENTEKVIEKLNILECKYTAYPHPHKEFITESDWLELAKSLDSAGKKMKDAGQLLSYHNHAVEFQRYGERTALDILFNETASDHLAGEIDTYWVQYGGGNPIKWVQKLKNRMPVIHLKDYGMFKDQIDMFEVGYGNLPMKEIITTALDCGVDYFLIEQDKCRRNPFESLKMSYEYLLNLDV